MKIEISKYENTISLFEGKHVDRGGPELDGKVLLSKELVVHLVTQVFGEKFGEALKKHPQRSTGFLSVALWPRDKGPVFGGKVEKPYEKPAEPELATGPSNDDIPF